MIIRLFLVVALIKIIVAHQSSQLLQRRNTIAYPAVTPTCRTTRTLVIDSREIKIPAVQRQRVTRCLQVVELGSIIPTGLLGSSSKTPARSTIRHIVAKNVQRRVSRSIRGELHADSRQFVKPRDVTSHLVRPRCRSRFACRSQSSPESGIRITESRAQSSCSSRR